MNTSQAGMGLEPAGHRGPASPTGVLRQAGRLLGGLLETIAVAYAFPVAILAVTLGIGAPLTLLVVGAWRLAEAVSRLGSPP